MFVGVSRVGARGLPDLARRRGFRRPDAIGEAARPELRKLVVILFGLVLRRLARFRGKFFQPPLVFGYGFLKRLGCRRILVLPGLGVGVVFAGYRGKY